MSADNFANSLDPDQTRQNVGPDLDLNCLTLMVFMKKLMKKKNKQEKCQTALWTGFLNEEESESCLTCM